MSAVPDSHAALDGKHYWNVWTANYRLDVGGYIEHAWCDEDKKVLCGANTKESGGMSYPHDLERPGCMRCYDIMKKRGALKPD